MADVKNKLLKSLHMIIRIAMIVDLSIIIVSSFVFLIYTLRTHHTEHTMDSKSIILGNTDLTHVFRLVLLLSSSLVLYNQVSLMLENPSRVLSQNITDTTERAPTALQKKMLVTDPCVTCSKLIKTSNQGKD